MREIDWDELRSSDLIDLTALSAAFKKYLMDVLGYDELEADFVVESDFDSPYDAPYILQDYDGNFTIDGREYELRFCHTDFCYVGLYHLAEVPPFEFYMFIDKGTLEDQTVGAYRKAKKLYFV